MKTKYNSKVPRTSGWQSQNEYDNLLADLSFSSLKALKHIYNKEIRDFPNHFDLNESENQSFYKEMLQRKHMIDEEYEFRKNNPQPYGEYFDAETGYVLNEFGEAIYGISFNEDEDNYVYHRLDGETMTTDIKSRYIMDDDYDDCKDVKVTPIKVDKKVVGYTIKESERDIKDIYNGWDYYSELDE